MFALDAGEPDTDEPMRLFELTPPRPNRRGEVPGLQIARIGTGQLTLPRGAKAVEIADGNTETYFLSAFGRASRTTVCS